MCMQWRYKTCPSATSAGILPCKASSQKKKEKKTSTLPVMSGKARGGEAVTRSACTVGSLLMYMYTYSYTYSYTYRYVECPQELCAA